jgi:hypothetical protein
MVSFDRSGVKRRDIIRTDDSCRVAKSVSVVEHLGSHERPGVNE